MIVNGLGPSTPALSLDGLRVGRSSVFKRLDQAELRRLLQAAKAMDFDVFLGLHPGLHQNEVVLLWFLRAFDSMATVRSYASVLCAFLNDLGTDFDQVRLHHVQTWLRQAKDAGRSMNTLNLRLNALKSFYRTLMDSGMVRMNPTAGTRNMKIRSEDKRADKVMDQEEVLKILRWARRDLQARDFLALATLYFCGLRCEELVKLRWGSLFKDIRGRWWARIEGKGAKERDVPLPPGLLDDMMAFRQHQFGVKVYDVAPGLDVFPVFPNFRDLSKGLGTKAVYNLVARAGREALGRRLHPHCFRHTHATHARLKGDTLEAIRVQMGHESYDTTLRYDKSVHLRGEPAGMGLWEEYGKIQEGGAAG